MSQLSFFSADLATPRVLDLGGLLAAQGQVSVSAGGARLSILLAQEWRGLALVREFRVRDVKAELIPFAAAVSAGWASGSDLVEAGSGAAGSVDAGLIGAGPVDGGLLDPELEAGLPDGTPARVLLRSERTHGLDELAAAWTGGAVKAVPPGFTAGAGLLRCWTLAAGRTTTSGFLLGLDPHAPDTYEPLASACARAGLAAVMIASRGGGPGLRIVGHRRHERLVELLGTPPPEAPRSAFPIPVH